MRCELNNAASHDAREVDELRSNPALAAAYLRIAMQALDDASERAGGVIMLRAINTTYADRLDNLAERAGISRDA